MLLLFGVQVGFKGGRARELPSSEHTRRQSPKVLAKDEAVRFAYWCSVGKNGIQI